MKVERKIKDLKDKLSALDKRIKTFQDHMNTNQREIEDIKEDIDQRKQNCQLLADLISDPQE